MAVFNTVSLGKLLEYRFDAECHSEVLLAAERLIERLAPRPLASVADVSDGNHASIAEWFTFEGVRYLKGAELSSFFIDDETPTYIPTKTYESLTRAHVKEDDVLLSVIGTVGPVGLVTNKYDRLSCSCKLAIVRSHSISPACLAIFLTTALGQKLIQRRTRGSVQQGMILPDLRKFPVPDFPEGLVSEVTELVAKASVAATAAAKLYPEAESELLERMKWKTVATKRRNVTFSTSLDEMLRFARLDAEFFHPSAKKLYAHVAREGATLETVVSRFRRGMQPEGYEDGGEIIVVKSKDIRGRGIAFDNCERATAAVWQDADARLQEGDLIINSTGRGTLGRAEAVGTLPQRVVGSVDLVLAAVDKTKAHPQYLALYLNSPPGMAQSERFQTGSSGQLHLYPEHVKKFVVFLPKDAKGNTDLLWQGRLAEKVERSTRARLQSQSFLMEAREKMEQALRSPAVSRKRQTAA